MRHTMRQSMRQDQRRTMRRRPWAGPALLAVIALFMVAACGGSASSPLDNVGAPITNTAGSAGGEAAATAAPAAQAPADTSGQGTDGGQGTGSVPGGQENPPSVPRDDLKIVYTGSLELVVDDMTTALAKAKTAVLATGGYIGASQESDNGDAAMAVITYRIPASRWDDALESLRGLASKITREQTQATEVGGQIVDLEARIRNLRASEQVLVDIAKGTGKISDLLEVQARIADVRGQIEALDGQHAQLADQVAYGTLVTTFGVPAPVASPTPSPTPLAKAVWDPSKDISGATDTFVSAGQTLLSAAIWFVIVWLPILLLLGVVMFVAWKLIRRFAPSVAPSAGTGGWNPPA